MRFLWPETNGKDFDEKGLTINKSKMGSIKVCPSSGRNNMIASVHIYWLSHIRMVKSVLTNLNSTPASPCSTRIRMPSFDTTQVSSNTKLFRVERYGPFFCFRKCSVDLPTLRSFHSGRIICVQIALTNLLGYWPFGSQSRRRRSKPGPK